jgi:hypothetical protein
MRLKNGGKEPAVGWPRLQGPVGSERNIFNNLSRNLSDFSITKFCGTSNGY